MDGSTSKGRASGGVALVTGGAGGIATAVAARLRDDGYRLLLVDVAPRVADAASALGAEAALEGVVADIADAHGVAAVVGAVDRVGAPLDVLVNCAGITRDARLGEMTAAQFADVIAVNLTGPLLLTRALGERLADGASVVNISSRSALGNVGQANYAASKAGLLGMTRALALQWAPRVRVNAVVPGLIETPMTAAMPERVLTKLVGRIPMSRIGAPHDIADAVAFLASADAAYVTGQTLVVCGGRSIAA